MGGWVSGYSASFLEIKFHRMDDGSFGNFLVTFIDHR
jgi:hypothetical protein